MGIQINGQTDTVTSTTAGGSVKVTPLAASTGLNVGTGASVSSPATNVLTLGTNNSERVRVSAAGSFGIGTNDPKTKLEVAGAAAFTQTSETIGTDQLQIGFNAPNGFIKTKNSSGSPASNLDFYSTDTSGNTNLGIRLQYTGNLGISTNNPTEKIHVVGKGIFGSGSAGRSQSFADGIHIQPTTTNATVVTGLCIGNDGSGSGTGGAIALGAGNATATTAAFIEGFYDGTGTSLTLKTSPSYGASAAIERLRIDNSGNILVNNATSRFIGQWEGGTANPATSNYFAGMETRLGADRNLILVSKTGDAGGNIIFQSGYTTNGTVSEKMRLDVNGRLGIGSVTPGTQLTVDQGTVDGNLFTLKNEEVSLITGVWGTGSTYPREVTLNATRNDSGSTPFLRLAGQGGIAFAVDLNTIQGSITSQGEFRIGTANQTAVSSDRVHVIGEVSIATVQTNLARVVMQERSGIWFSLKDGSGTHYGSISRNGAGVTYGSNSDYRLKENITSLSKAIEKVKALKPVTFNFIDRPEDIVDGFLAHEVQEIAPYAVTGEKDGYDISGDVLDSDGKVVKQFVPEPEELEEGQTWVEKSRDVKIQQLDPAKLVPVLTAALQEALAKIETLEARLDAAGL